MHLIQGDPLPVGAALGLCNAAEALIVAGLIARYFGAGFSLDRLRHVLGLLAAAVAGTVVSGIGGAITYGLWRGAPFLTTWQAWFASDVIGVVIVAPLVIGLTAALREPLPGSGLLEGAAALVGLAVVTMIIISLPPGSLGDGGARRTALSNVAITCRPLSTGHRRGGRLHGFAHRLF